jgi:pimeloyl-ACP methyl ester carboxylesterase
MRSFPTVAACLMAANLMVTGCVNTALTKAITEAPNLREKPRMLRSYRAAQLQKSDATYAFALRVPVGPPAAELSVAVINPGNYKVAASVGHGEFKNGVAPVWPQTDWTLPAQPLDPPSPPKATVILLHGFQDSKEDMIHWALYLAQHGYRAVPVDLRGHGRSTGDWVGYGAFEARDLKQVIDELERRQLVAGRIGILGISYGASVGLQLAGLDKRVEAVVALEPFSDPRIAVKEFARAVVPGFVRGWTDQDFSTAEDRASQMAGFSWNNANVERAVAESDASILYVYADNDHWISPQNSQRLAEVTHGIHAIETVHFQKSGIEDHVLLSWLLEPMAPGVVTWFDECLARPRDGLRARLNAQGFLD